MVERERGIMPHQHWCEFAGHYWECSGTAVRLFQAEPTICICFDHGVPMEQGDHSSCGLELLSCPEHRADQMRAMGYEPGYVIPSSPEGDERSLMFTDADGKPTVGFCLWCGADFYSFEDHEAHVADDMAACAVFQKMKDEPGEPPVLRQMFEEAGLGDPEGNKNDE